MQICTWQIAGWFLLLRALPEIRSYLLSAGVTFRSPLLSGKSIHAFTIDLFEGSKDQFFAVQCGRFISKVTSNTDLTKTRNL